MCVCGGGGGGDRKRVAHGVDIAPGCFPQLI
eukprot:COSAG06_NODE_2170_length_7417_cov_354.408172_6_plen_30_part_01